MNGTFFDSLKKLVISQQNAERDIAVAVNPLIKSLKQSHAQTSAHIAKVKDDIQRGTKLTKRRIDL